MSSRPSFHAGEIVFFKHPKQSWVLGKVTSSGPDPKIKGKFEFTCTADDAERQCVGEAISKLKEEDITSCREDLIDEEPHDLLNLTVLHDSTLLRCLYLRYMRDIIYTNIGAIVVALNPFNFKIPWYLDGVMPEYLKEGPVIEKNLPHSWAQAHNTYNEMMQDGSPQTILVSGESGAGKTEASKIVMKYLAAISNTRGSEEEKAAGLAVGTRLNACSPLLEAFGNARTVRNDNSSRFGKFMKIKFSTEGQLKGAFTIKYLLEKSRIVTAAENERIYHAFYIVVRGSYKSKLQAHPEANYKSLNAGKCLQNSEFNTNEDFQEVLDSMTKIGMGQDAIESTWATVLGVLSAQNINFLEDGEGSKIAEPDRKYLDDLGRLWKVDTTKLEKEFTTTTLVVAKDLSTRLLRPVMAVDVRDALSKSLYNGLFGWLVDRCNELCDDPTANGSWIGLLDIFGFEDFAYNSFEQLCINLTNETLQNHYNTYIFDKDMAECRAEGIDVADIKCPDNKPCLRLITAPGGILALLDEECSLGKGSDSSFLEKINQAHGNSKNPFFDKNKMSRNTFIINHYAASVTYTVENWLEKNRDTIKDDIRLIMRASADTNIAGFLDAPIPLDQQKGKKVTVGGFFKDQLNQLMEVINSTNPHWIRCIKPHPAKKPKMFDGVQTLNQLESSGVLGTVKIRKAGYPIRTAFSKFFMRYRILLPGGKAPNAGNEREASALILKACSMDSPKYAQIGKTKVFMKSEAFPLIERKRNDLLAVSGLTLQRVGRAYRNRVETNKNWCQNALRESARVIVREYRDYLRRSKEVREERARLRREAELKFRGLKQALGDEVEREKQTIFEEFAKKVFEFVDQRNQSIEREKARIQYFKASRETFQKQESMVRIRIFEEFTAHLNYLSDLYYREIEAFIEVESNFLAETEESSREAIEIDEMANRNRIWRMYIESQSRGVIESLAAEGISSKALWYESEELQRGEICARMVIARSEQITRKHFRRQRGTLGAEVQRLEAARLEFELIQSKAVRHYQTLLENERAKVGAEMLLRERAMSSSVGGGQFVGGVPTESLSEHKLFHESKAATAANGVVPPLLRAAPDDLNPFSVLGAERLRPTIVYKADPSVAVGQFGFGGSSAYSSPSPPRVYSHLTTPTAYTTHVPPAAAAQAAPAGGGGGGGRGGVGAGGAGTPQRGSSAEGSGSSSYTYSASAYQPRPYTQAPANACSSALPPAPTLPTTTTPYNYLHNTVSGPPAPHQQTRALGRQPSSTNPLLDVHGPPSPAVTSPPQAPPPAPTGAASPAPVSAASFGLEGSAQNPPQRPTHVHGSSSTLMTYPEAVMRTLNLGADRGSAAAVSGGFDWRSLHNKNDNNNNVAYGVLSATDLWAKGARQARPIPAPANAAGGLGLSLGSASATLRGHSHHPRGHSPSHLYSHSSPAPAPVRARLPSPHAAGGYSVSSPYQNPSNTYGPTTFKIKSALDPTSTTDLARYIESSAASLAQRQQQRNAALLGEGGGGGGGELVGSFGAGGYGGYGSGKGREGERQRQQQQQQQGFPFSSAAGSPYFSTAARGGGGGEGRAPSYMNYPTVSTREGPSSARYTESQQQQQQMGGFGLYEVGSPSPRPAQMMYQQQYHRQPSPAGGGSSPRRGW